jgi:ABC-type Fe3+/spermidine/putrescine transport system ATPase subunit
VFKAQVVQASMRDGLVASAWGELRCSLPEDVAEGDDVWVAVRPEGITLFLEKPDLPNNVMTGKLESATFLGDYVECQVKVADYRFQVKADPFTRWNPPSPVYVYLPPERCIVFHIA